jgi:hypothetical protein
MHTSIGRSVVKATRVKLPFTSRAKIQSRGTSYHLLLQKHSLFFFYLSKGVVSPLLRSSSFQLSILFCTSRSAQHKHPATNPTKQLLKAMNIPTVTIIIIHLSFRVCLSSRPSGSSSSIWNISGAVEFRFSPTETNSIPAAKTCAESQIYEAQGRQWWLTIIPSNDLGKRSNNPVIELPNRSPIATLNSPKIWTDDPERAPNRN